MKKQTKKQMALVAKFLGILATIAAAAGISYSIGAAMVGVLPSDATDDASGLCLTAAALLGVAITGGAAHAYAAAAGILDNLSVRFDED